MGVSESSQLVFLVDGVMQKTWDDAVARWLIEKADKASLKSDQCIFRWLEPHLCGLSLSKITRTSIDELALAKLKSGVSNGTVNRMLALLRSVLRRAFVEWEWIDYVPRIRLLREPKRRVRFLTLAEAQLLLSHLPESMALMAAFSLATGLRKSNVTGLQWSQVDLHRSMAWVHPDQSKTRKAIGVPLSVDAMRVLELCKGRHPVFVFAMNSSSTVKISVAAWRRALEDAGIEDFRWHDLRHTWASWHVQNGTPLNVLQELGGWESPEMVRRYAHFSATHLMVYVDKMPTMMSEI